MSKGKVLDTAIEVEYLLKELGGTGRGLHNLLDSAIEGGAAIPRLVIRNIRELAVLRNKIAHEKFVLSEDDAEDFETMGKLVIKRLKAIRPGSAKTEPEVAVKTAAVKKPEPVAKKKAASKVEESAAKKTSEKTARKASPTVAVKKPVAKKAAIKTVGSKVVAKKAPAKKPTVKKAVVNKVIATKVAVKKTPAKKVAAKKAPAKTVPTVKVEAVAVKTGKIRKKPVISEGTLLAIERTAQSGSGLAKLAATFALLTRALK
ncbi:Histone H1-like nucleoprotein HC2 [Caballeronia peredens]|nr:Histone H1-like nucleoprotein HC2 [Caballeronia peredens]